MQPAGNRHVYVFNGTGLRRRRGGAEVRVAGLRVSEYHGSFTADLPTRCRALRLSQTETLFDGSERTGLQRRRDNREAEAGVTALELRDGLDPAEIQDT